MSFVGDYVFDKTYGGPESAAPLSDSAHAAENIGGMLSMDRYIEGFLAGQAIAYCEMVSRGVRLAGQIDAPVDACDGLAKLPKIRIHDLRHTAATLLLAQGIHPKAVQEMLGHSQISMTMDVYSHVLPHLGQEAAEKMNAVLRA